MTKNVTFLGVWAQGTEEGDLSYEEAATRAISSGGNPFMLPEFAVFMPPGNALTSIIHKVISHLDLSVVSIETLRMMGIPESWILDKRTHFVAGCMVITYCASEQEADSAVQKVLAGYVTTNNASRSLGYA